MPQNTHSLFKREQLGHSKKLSDQSKTESQQDEHQILQLHIRHLGLVRESSSESLGTPSACAAYSTHSVPYLGWLHSVPPALFSWCPMVLPPPTPRFHWFRLHLHSFIQWLLRLKLFQPCHGWLGFSGSTKPSQKTTGPVKPVNVAAKFCCWLGVMPGSLDHTFQQPLCVLS